MTVQLRECYQMPLSDFVRDFPEIRSMDGFRNIDFTDEQYIVRVCPSLGLLEVGYPSDSNWRISAP